MGAEPIRKAVLSRRSLLAALPLLSAAANPVQAKDYGSPQEALDEMDRLAGICGMRLGALRRSRASADLLVSRFLRALQKHRDTREATRHKFGLPKGADPASQLGDVDGALAGLQKALDDLMSAYGESLPVFGDAMTVSRLAVDMVDVSRLRTVIDLWIDSEAA